MSDFTIDPAFSVYKLAERRHDISTIISHRKTMSQVSYIIEETARTDHVNNVVFSGFQYLSKFIPQMERYRQIAQYAKHVYVFGVADTKLPAIDNISYVTIEPHYQLAKEWFIVSHGVHLSTALVTEEISNFTDPDHKRQFNGFWIFNDPMVQIMYEWLSNEVNTRENTQIATDIQSAKHHELTQKLTDRFARLITTGSLGGSTKKELDAFKTSTIAAINTNN